MYDVESHLLLFWCNWMNEKERGEREATKRKKKRKICMFYTFCKNLNNVFLFFVVVVERK